MHARSALFDVYGDHVAHRGGWAPVAGLIRIVETLDISAPSTRTAISRMAREGWLEPEERDGQRGYRATSRAVAHLDDARERIYGAGQVPWDGRWDVLVLAHQASRAGRDRVTSQLRYLGYAPLVGTTWVGPRRHVEVPARLRAEGVAWTGFASRHDGDDRELAGRLWDLDAIAARYHEFLAGLEWRAVDADAPPAQAYAARAHLVHRWRLFLFEDPGLPDAVLPESWPRPAAIAQFHEAAATLHPQADAYVDACLSRRGAPD